MASLHLPTSPFLVNLQVPLLYVNNIVALAIGPQHQAFRLAYSLPVLVLLLSQSLSRDWDVNWGLLYAINLTSLLLALVYVDWILLSSPDKEKWRRVRYNEVVVATPQGKENGNGKLGNGNAQSNENVVPQGFWSRARWGVRLAFASTRYPGWSCRVKNVPVVHVHSSYPRTIFIAQRVLRMTFFFLLKNALISWTVSTPHGSWQDVKHLKGVVGLAGRSLPYKMFFVWIHLLITYASLHFTGSAYAIVSVATGLSHPSECPVACGDLRHLYSLREAWSTVWHQQCRRIVSAPGIWLARDVLHLRKGSFASKNLQLAVAFALSGIAHGGASMLIHRSFEDDAVIMFFLLQIPAIVVEDYVVEFGKSLGLRDSFFWRLTGLVWTMFVLGVTGQNWVDKILGRGIWIHEREVDWFGLAPKI